MRRFSVALLLNLAHSLRDSLEANPMRRVITLLQKTQKELEEEAKNEETLYEKFMCYCDKNNEGMKKDAEAAAQKIEELEGRAEAEEAEKTRLDQELAQHKNEREQAKQGLEKATAIREKERKAYEDETSEFRYNIDTLNGAIDALEKGMGASAFIQAHGQGAARLLALVSSFFHDDILDHRQQAAITDFLQGKNPYGAYAVQSGEIVGILKQLKERMDSDLGGVVEREEAAAASFTELKAAKLREIQAHTNAIESKQVRSGELGVAVVTTKNEVKDTQESLEATRVFLAELEKSCATKQQEYEERTKTRNDEIAAISEAIQILNDDDALNLFKGTLSKPTSFLQKSATTKSVQKARSLLQHLARISQGTKASQYSLISSLTQGQTGKVDFSKVIAMVDRMVEVLQKEQTDDDNHRDWCTEEFDRNDDETRESQRKSQQLASFIEESQERVQQLAEEIASAQEEVKQLDKAVAEATEQRKKEHEEYVSSQTDLTAALQLIEKAKNRLNQFYNPALHKAAPERELTEEERISQNLGAELEPEEQAVIAGTSQTVYMQIRSHTHTKGRASQPPPPPETWGAYQTKGQKTNGVVALMDRLMNELRSDQQQGEHEEKTSQRDYEKLMADSKATREELSVGIANNEEARATLQSKVGEAKTSQQGESEVLMGLKQYLSELHSSCDFLTQNYEMRKETRSREIDGLKQAKAILSGASFS